MSQLFESLVGIFTSHNMDPVVSFHLTAFGCTHEDALEEVVAATNGVNTKMIQRGGESGAGGKDGFDLNQMCNRVQREDRVENS